MTEDSDSIPVSNVGGDVRESIQSGEFDRFLIFSYNVSEEMLDWFPEGSDTCICTRTSEAADIRASKFGTGIDVRSRDVHAKIYLFWNDQKIRCWLGSFNFTSGGLSSSVEWSAFFESGLRPGLELQEVTDGAPPSNAAKDEELINQVIDFCNSYLNDREPTFSENIFQNLPHESALVHTESNTMKRAVREILSNADSANIQYYTPYINRSGVNEFSRWFPQSLGKEDVSFNIFASRPERVIDEQGSFIKSSHVEHLDREYDSFTLWTRSTGGDGQVLADGREIRDGLAHLKVICISYTTPVGTEETQTILTTANLTENAWKPVSGNLEIGLWVRDEQWNQLLYEFYSSNLSACYSRVDEDEFEDIDRRISEAEAGDSQQEFWFEDFFEGRVSVSAEKVVVEWEDWYPELDNLNCHIHLKNLVSGSADSVTVSLERVDSRYFANLANLRQKSNTSIEFLDFAFETAFRPPQRELIKDQLSEIRSGDFDKIGGWDELIVDGETWERDTLTVEEIPDDVDFAAVRKKRKNPARLHFRYNVESQPLLPARFFQSVEGGSIELLDTDLPIITIAPSDGLDFPFDTIETTSEGGDAIRQIGFIENDETVSYIFHPANGGDEIEIRVGKPFKEYYDDTAVNSELPDTNSNSFITSERLGDLSLEHSVPSVRDLGLGIDEDNFISNHTQLSISAPADLLDLVGDVPLRYAYSPTGYFYSPPQFLGLDKSLVPNRPYAEIEYRGVAEFDCGLGTARLFTGSNRFLARKQLVENIRLNFNGIPQEVPLAEIGETYPLAWLVVDSDYIVAEDIPDELVGSLTVDIYKNGKLLPSTEPLPTLHSGKLFATPIPRAVFEEQVDFHIVVRPVSNEGKAMNFAWAAESFEFHTSEHSGNEFKLHHGSSVSIITDSKDSELPALQVDRIYRKRLGQQLHFNDAFEMVDERKLQIRPMRDEVLYLTELSAD